MAIETDKGYSNKMMKTVIMRIMLNCAQYVGCFPQMRGNVIVSEFELI